MVFIPMIVWNIVGSTVAWGYLTAAAVGSMDDHQYDAAFSVTSVTGGSHTP